MFPGIKPIVMKKKLENIRSSFFEVELGYNTIENPRSHCGLLPLVYSDFNELFIEDVWGTPRISPQGAKLLLLLDKEKFFERKSQEEPIELLQYIASAPDIIQAQINSDLEKLRQQELEVRPELAQERDFTYTILNNISIKQFGMGRGQKTMTIGGIEVTKNVSVYKSNSLKSQDADVTFLWISADGQEHRIEKESLYKSNRRNDSMRNWGLPE